MNQLISNRASKTILIVDDNIQYSQFLVDFFKQSIYQLFVAISGKQAIQMAIKIKPDIILLDIIMPEIDGFDTCKQLKANSQTRDIPIIFVTALTEIEDKIRGLELGAVDYITKPFRPEELLLRVKKQLEIQSFKQSLIADIDRQKLLLETNDLIRQSLDLKSTLKTAAAQIRAVLHCDSVWVLSLHNRNAFLEAYNSSAEISIKFHDPISLDDIYRGYQRDYVKTDYQNYDLKYSFCLPTTIKVINNENSLKLTERSPCLNFKNRLVSPIYLNSSQTEKFHNEPETLWGWLIADHTDSYHQWHTKEINLLDSLTAQLAVGIQQGLLHQQMVQQAFLDPLTGVYNRRYLDRQLDIEWGRLRRISSSLSLIMCDVDCFKLFNDYYGHQKGDKCLKKVAEAIGSVIKRPADIVTRYGGEEFTVILPETSPLGAIKVAEDIRITVQKLNIPHASSTVDSVVTISVGIASTIPNAEDQPQLLIEAADLALYQAKEKGRNRTAVYPEPISRSQNRNNLEVCWIKRLRQALKHNLFTLYVQPITSLESADSIKYYEILLRLTDRDEEVILPYDFLEIAERNSLMPAIDTWVINNLLDTLTATNSSSYWQNYRFAINLSGASLNQKSFLNFLQQKLANYSLPAELFCFEITENVAVLELDRAAKFIKTMKNIGCSFALDDFGTGMSSLSYLKNLPVDYLKIDGSFITELNQDKSSKIMVEAINHIAEGIGLKTVAEFVENEHIFNAVKNLNIDYAQGYHLGRPQALASIF